MLTNLLQAGRGEALGISRAVLEALPGAVLIWDRDGRVRFASAGAERLFAGSSADLLGRAVDELLDAPIPADDGRAPAWAGTPDGMELPAIVHRPDGATVAARLGLGTITLDDGDNRIAIIREDLEAAHRRDPGAHRGADSLLAALAPVGVIVATADQDLRYTWIFNPHPDFVAAAILGKRDDELAGHEGSRELVRLKQQVIDQRCGARREIDFELSDGMRRYDVTAVPLFDDGRDTVGVATAAIDVTQVRTLMRYQEDLFAMIAHDLRNPVAVIHGHARRLGGASPDAREILHQARRLDRMVGDLLGSAVLGGGQVELRREQVELGALVRSVAERASNGRRRHLRVELPDQLVVGHWDPYYLERVVENLLTNAVKYSPASGAITVVVEARPHEVRVSVRDEGVGVDPADAPELFERFYRAPAQRRRAPGVGLGLYIARGIVEAHGGRIWIDSAGPGAGSTFSFTLPYR